MRLLPKQRKMQTVILITITVCIFSSCLVHHPGDLRGLYSYYKVTKKEHPSFIQRPDSNLCSIQPKEPIVMYKIRGEELRKCFTENTKSMVYFWIPNCSAPVCIPPNYAQEFCSRHGIDLFIIACYYDYDKMSFNFELDRPIFGVDTEYYKTNLTDKYLKRFKADLWGENSIDESEFGRFHLFESDSLIIIRSKIEDLLI